MKANVWKGIESGVIHLFGKPYSYCTWSKEHNISEVIFRKVKIDGVCRLGKYLGGSDEVGHEY